MTNSNEPLLTRKEAAVKLRVSLPTLKKLRDANVLQAYKIGKSVRYKQSDIEKLLTPKESVNG